MAGPRNPAFARWAGQTWQRFATRRYAKAGLFSADSPTGMKIVDDIKQRVRSGKTCYIVGLGVAGHNAGAALLKVSLLDGIQLLSNDEEERFSGEKHYKHYPKHAINELHRRLLARGVQPSEVAAWGTSWDYSNLESLFVRSFAEEFPYNLKLLKSDDAMDPAEQFKEALQAPNKIREQLGLDVTPQLLMFPHHENHASFSYAASPFAKNGRPTMISVVDGTGDRGSISYYRGENGKVTELYCNQSVCDSLGWFYSVISSTQGGWTPLSSEGRYMGAVAWGDDNRLTNPYYRRLRDIFHFGADGQVQLNRQLANWHIAGWHAPYTPALEAILGKPIPLERMWNPDAVLDINSIQHSAITRDRVDLAAATQLVFEDVIFHIVDYLIRNSRSDQLVMSGGTALNALANMRLLEHFDNQWYKRNLGMDTQLKLWIPPVTGDAGVTIGAAYSAAMRAEVPCGDNLKQASWCGIPATVDEIQAALDKDPKIAFQRLGNVNHDADRLRVADLMAYTLERDGVLGLYQGSAETGPRALGQRSILANPCNPDTRQILNERVKFREAIRPLAPMVTREHADRFFELSEGAAADDYNAYRYMVLAVKARRLAHEKIPAVVHKDGTCRVQIVTSESNPLVHDYLQAMGRRLGAEVSVNTSLNVGGPICQTPAQALAVVKRAKALTGLILVGGEGEMFLAWHAVDTDFKDGGKRLQKLVSSHAAEL